MYAILLFRPYLAKHGDHSLVCVFASLEVYRPISLPARDKADTSGWLIC